MHNVKLAAYNGCGGDSVTKPITVNAYPTTTITPIDTTICEGTSATLTAGGGSTYSWSNSSTSSSITVSPTVTTNYWVTSANGACPGDTASTNVNVNAVPIVVANANPIDTVCLGSLVSFSMNGSNAIYYSWDFGDGNTSSIPNTTHNYTAVGTYTSTLTGVYGVCSNTNQITIVVDSCNPASGGGGGGPIGIDESTFNQLVKVFPNPANSFLTIDATEANVRNMNIEIVSNTGQIIENIILNNNKTTIDLTYYSKGMYLIKFNINNNIFSKRIVILK